MCLPSLFSISPPAQLYRNTPIEQHWGKVLQVHVCVFFLHTQNTIIKTTMAEENEDCDVVFKVFPTF